MTFATSTLVPMVTIPAGVFNGQPIDAFQLGRTPVTNEQYAAHVDHYSETPYVLLAYNVDDAGPAYDLVRGKSPQDLLRKFAKRLPKSEDGSGVLFVGATIFKLRKDISSTRSIEGAVRKDLSPVRFDEPNQPVVCMSWCHAFEYCVSNGLFLPTDDQWSYAAGVHQGRKYATSTGEPYAADGETKLAHFSERDTVDVDHPRYADGPHGLRHMSGNVCEWTIDPKHPWSFNLRGGSWVDAPHRKVEARYIEKGHLMGSLVFGFRVCAEITDGTRK
jgi:formylglycine-generating enzyme required for sulfatase activity